MTAVIPTQIGIEVILVSSYVGIYHHSYPFITGRYLNTYPDFQGPREFGVLSH